MADKTFAIQPTITQHDPSTQPDKYHIDVVGPENKSADIPYGTDPLETVLTFTAPGDYEASAVLWDTAGSEVGGKSTTTFTVQPGQILLLTVGGLSVTDAVLRARPAARRS